MLHPLAMPLSPLPKQLMITVITLQKIEFSELCVWPLLEKKGFIKGNQSLFAMLHPLVWTVSVQSPANGTNPSLCSAD